MGLETLFIAGENEKLYKTMLEYTLTSYYILWYFPKVDKNVNQLICTYMLISSLPNEKEGHIFERTRGGV